MEEKKFDPYQFIGFILIALIMTWMLMNQQPVDETTATANKETSVASSANGMDERPSVDPLQDNNSNYAAVLQSQTAQQIDLSNEFLSFTFSTKGGQMTAAVLTGLTNYVGDPLMLVDGNQYFNLRFTTLDGRNLQTADLYFTPQQRQENGTSILELKADLGPNQWIAMTYTLPESDYMLGVSFASNGIVRSNAQQELEWTLDAFRNSRSVEYENRYTALTYGYEGEKVDELSVTSDDEEVAEDVQWIGYKQHFFNSILIPSNSIEKVRLDSKNLVESENVEQKFTKRYTSVIPLQSKEKMNHKFQWYFGPSEYKTLQKYGLGIEKNINFGWGIFGWINKSVFIPLFDFLSSFLPFGIAIIIMTIIVRLAMSPVTYRSYVSQIKMKVLKPEVDEINAKYPKDQVKRQQETMALYTKAGANPMSGCLPALLQLPVFYALFSFFPVAYALRQKSFLWADDLSSYDSVYDLPFNIPFYGDHISLFPILASVAIFIYTMMTMGQQQATQQPGMPNMKFIMYLMPLMMLFFFNNYASGLSLYYFVSNILTIVLMLVIKNFVVSEEKIFTQIEENKKKPKKKGGFQARLQKAMEEAEKQQRGKRGR